MRRSGVSSPHPLQRPSLFTYVALGVRAGWWRFVGDAFGFGGCWGRAWGEPVAGGGVPPVGWRGRGWDCDRGC